MKKSMKNKKTSPKTTVLSKSKSVAMMKGTETTSSTFKVSGKTKKSTGEIVTKQNLKIYSINVNSASTYKTIKKTSGLTEKAGFGLLKELQSDCEGYYSSKLTNTDDNGWKMKLDFVVFAIDGESVLGYSDMVNSENFCKTNDVRNLDVVIYRSADTKTEYKKVYELLVPYARKNNLVLKKLTDDQITYISGELEQKPYYLKTLSLASNVRTSVSATTPLEIFYGIGRQNITLDWLVLFNKKDSELKSAIKKSSEEKIIGAYTDEKINTYIDEIHTKATEYRLNYQSGKETTVDTILSYSLPQSSQRVAFLSALRKHEGDYKTFWTEVLPNDPEFANNQGLITKLKFTNQLTILSGNHQPLVKELQVTKDYSTVDRLMELNTDEWKSILQTTGVPDTITGDDDEEKITNYTTQLQNTLNAAFPTQKISLMLSKNELPVSTVVSNSIRTFFSSNPDFDISNSRIHNFNIQGEAKDELLRMQRVFQVSPTADAMAVLMKKNLDSAHAISGYSKKGFLKMFASAFETLTANKGIQPKASGSSVSQEAEELAELVYQRASFISTKSDINYRNIYDLIHLNPSLYLPETGDEESTEIIKTKIPNYTELFGSPDICECSSCTSVYGAAAYLVDLLYLLSKSTVNEDGISPLKVFELRRPDILHLPLTCENTNTLIPYVDIVNEIMEFYTANNELNSNAAYDTGDATADELRANPQNFDFKAYEIIKEKVYPFNLPYHQALDAIRIYSSYLGSKRYEIMKLFLPDSPEPEETKAIEAEILSISEEEYLILTKEKFDGSSETRSVQEFYGEPTLSDLDYIAYVTEFINKTGVTYTDIVELVNTRFINPDQEVLTYFDYVFSNSHLSSSAIYEKLKGINLGLIDPSTDPIMKKILNDKKIKHVTFKKYVKMNFEKFNSIITLYEPNSLCSLDTTTLMTIKKVYNPEELPPKKEYDPVKYKSGLNETQWSKIHRFIRLWKKLGWSIHETDLMLTALSYSDITTDVISELSNAILLNEKINLSINLLATLWGDIDTYGEASLYKSLFLNKAFKSSTSNSDFEADEYGNYLTDSGKKLFDYLTDIQAFFKLTEEDLNLIIADVSLTETDILNVRNVSKIYRYKVFSKALGLKIEEFIEITIMFGIDPFDNPSTALSFCQIVSEIEDAGFSSEMLNYIFNGALSADSKVGLGNNEVLLTGKAICDSYTTIELENPETPSVNLTSEIIQGKLLLTFSSDSVSKLIQILDDTIVNEAISTSGLTITYPTGFPESLKSKFTYIKSTGRIQFTGVMTDGHKTNLIGLNTAFTDAVNIIYSVPDTFLKENFSGVFSDSDMAYLVNHAAATITLEEKLLLVYTKFIPLIKQKLREDAITQYIASLISLSNEATATLISYHIQALITNLSQTGFFGSYYLTPDFNLPPQSTQIDACINFETMIYPDPAVTTENFYVNWETYISPPATDDYTFVLSVKKANDAFTLSINDEIMLEKTAGDTNLTFETPTPVNLNSSELSRVKLLYAHSESDSGISLSWKTATSSLETIPTNSTYPTNVVLDFADKVTLYHRCSEFINGFALEDLEVDHLIKNSSDFADIFYFTDTSKLLTKEHWNRIYDFVTLRESIPETLSTLINIFDVALKAGDFKGEIYNATSWDKEVTESIIAKFGLTTDSFKNEKSLTKLYALIKILSYTGISFESLQEWGKITSDFTTLYNVSQLLKSSLKAKYEDEDWLDLSTEISDKLRDNQRQALISNLLMDETVKNWGATDADGLFEYFLIDVQMGTCMDTSRIVQANAAIQMFINRCFLNLESNTETGKETGVSPVAIDKDQWSWMEYYRVWEANRKVFLYSENWLEPDWRNDKSEFFEELESELVQNDITDRSVETAFRNYLTKLNDVANLDVCGMYEEEDTGILHVFARSRNAPYKYYYRTRNEFEKWSTWETVQVDIKGVEDGENSGVHLIPIMWKNRLFVFWPEFLQKQEDSESITLSSSSSYTSAQLRPSSYYEIRLGWSEYVEGKWSPKQISNEFITSTGTSLQYASFKTDINSSEGLSIELFKLLDNLNLYSFDKYHSYDKFKLIDIQGKVSIVDQYSSHSTREFPYSSNYMRIVSASEISFELNGNTFLNKKNIHKVLYSNNHAYNSILISPFFYIDDSKTYFVRPKFINAVKAVQEHDNYVPSFTEFDVSNVAISKSTERKSMAKAMLLEDYINEDIKVASQSFSGTNINLYSNEIGLEFHTFYHPFSSKFVQNLNKNGLDGLMESDTSIPDDEGDTFKDNYEPNSTYVPIPSDFYEPLKTYYKENVCFDPYGANSSYNYELFFHAPLYIALRLSNNGKYEEAMKWFHYIFDPTSDEEPTPGSEEVSRFWKVFPFKHTTSEDTVQKFLEDMENATDEEISLIEAWRNSPFDPHLIAQSYPICYMKYTVVKYVQNMLNWADSLFRQFTRESVNEALQLYVIANHILGPRPQYVPKRTERAAETYASLESQLDAFGNARVDMENLFLYSSNISYVSDTSGPSLSGVSSQLYFCIPSNESLIELWDTAADRLYKIRNCMNIDGVVTPLALFAPPIDPAALIKAASAGLSLGDILGDLNSPPPLYRFSYLIQKANEFCNEVKSLGSTLLSAFEKKESEELSKLRTTHETSMLELMTIIKEKNVLEAQANRESLSKSRDSAAVRFEHYKSLLANEAEVPEEPSISNNDTSLPADTSIEFIKSELEDTPEDEDGIKIIKKEKQEFDYLEEAHNSQNTVNSLAMAASILSVIPNANADVKPFGIGAGAVWGGQFLANATMAVSKAWEIKAANKAYQGNVSSKWGTYIRRQQDWILQANLAAKEIIQLDKQMVAADIRQQVAEKDLENHLKQIENSKEVETFLSDKFTNDELYRWMKEQLYSVYKQSYNLAYDLAKKAEKAYKYELGNEDISFIKYGYWDSTYQGLAAGEKLQLALRQLEKSYIEENKRELELTKNISLASLNPLALIELRETGKCYVNIPEELLDLDYQGHYFRRIKSVRLSIPCIAGPYTTINCSLRLLKNYIRTKTTGDSYVHNNEVGYWIDDDRFRESVVPVTAIATSTGLNDSGVFELNFRDERYLPFEGAGAISEWCVELTQTEELRQFDFSTISDIIFQMSYTAKEDSGQFRTKAVEYLKNVFLKNTNGISSQPFIKAFELKTEFSTEWYKFLHTTQAGDDQILTFKLTKERFPYLARNGEIEIVQIDFIARCTNTASYELQFAYEDSDGNWKVDESKYLLLSPNSKYGTLKKGPIDSSNSLGVILSEMDLDKNIRLKLRLEGKTTFTELETNPEEVEDLYMIIHFKHR